MAYTNTPQTSTYKTQRLTFIGSPQQRDGSTTKDQRFINLFPELIKSNITDGKKYYLKSRPGLEFRAQQPSGEGRGIFYYGTKLYTVIGNTLYEDGSVKQVLGTSTGPVGFCAYNGNYDALILLDGVKGWVIKLSDYSITQITDADFPTPHVVTPVALDGYLFVCKSGTADIYNSDLNDPLNWTSGDIITAEMFPDNIVALVKNNNYIYAVGTEAIEYFYDAANATGSPLSRNDSAVQQFGSNAPYTVVQTDNEVILCGDSGNGGRCVWAIDGFKAVDVSIEPIREALDQEGDSLDNATAICLRTAGHKFYIITLYNSKRNLVYDFDEKMWHEWQFGDPANPFFVPFATDSTIGFPIMLTYSGGIVANLKENIYTDVQNASATWPIICQATTVKLDFDTVNRKFMYRLAVVGDSPNNNTDTQLTVEWSDDDYNTWYGPRTLNMNGVMSAITRLGYFRRRAFRLTYTQPYPLRMEAIEVDINVGGT